MRQVAREHAANNPGAREISPRPCEYFDLICGTSTGGLIALMLGRLQMSVDDAILNYKILSKKIFSSFSNDPKASFNEKTLEEEIKNIVSTAVIGGQSPSMQLKDEQPDPCPTFVVATSLRAGGAIRMRSFGTRHDDPFPASIWQVARATFAAPTYFLPITIDDVDYGDGGMGWNNPAKEALAEARNKWPDRPIGIFVSIGTGLEDALHLNDTSKEVSNAAQLLLQNTSPMHAFKLAVAEYAVNCVTSCELIHREISEHCDRDILEGNYFRLNVPQGMAAIGLAEWDKLGDMISLTNRYMDHGEMKKTKQRIAELLRDPQRAKVKSKYLPIFNVPYRQNPIFTGHANTLRNIHQSLVLNARPGLTSSYIIHGLGGIGKTQVAIEYSYRYRNEFDIICWLQADDYEMLLTSYSHLYENSAFRDFTGLKLADENNLEIIATRLKLWFENCYDIRWLLIIDNADKLERHSVTAILQKQTIGNLIPRGSGGSVLITSRNRSALVQFKSNGEELLVMKEDEAMGFLFKCSNANSNELEDAVGLVRDLGRLPLAIEQAGGFIQGTGVTIPEYRRLYNKNKSKALREGLSDTHRFEYYRETVSTTWNVSFNAVHRGDHLASIILQIAAFLDGKQIQKDLFYDAKLSINEDDEILSEWKVNKALGMLMSYSLVRPIEGQESVEMHSLVQSVIRNDDKTDRMKYFMWSTELVQKRYPWGADANKLKDCRKYLSHAQNCVAIAEELHIESWNIERILESMAGYFWLVGQFRESLSLYQKALKILDSQFGVDNVRSTYPITGIGMVCDSQRKYAEASTWYEQALKIKEREFGVDHIESADTINNMGNVYKNQGKYAEAMSWYERALKIFEREFGVDHINSAIMINNISEVYRQQGKYTEAISWYKRALRIREREFGADYINSADTINNMGNVYNSQGKYIEAMTWYERALKIFEREFGVDHINSADIINNIGVVYKNQGKYAEAISWYERALKIKEREFGVDHPNSASTLHNIGQMYKQMADLVSAKSYFERAMRLHQQSRGAEHEFTVDSERELTYVINALNNSRSTTKTKWWNTKRLFGFLVLVFIPVTLAWMWQAPI